MSAFMTLGSSVEQISGWLLQPASDGALARKTLET
jgi:hypothetical protein